MNEFVVALNELVRLTVISNEAMAEYEKNPDSTEIESVFDEAYKAEFQQYMTCIKKVMPLLDVSFHDGKSIVMNMVEVMTK